MEQVVELARASMTSRSWSPSLGYMAAHLHRRFHLLATRVGDRVHLYVMCSVESGAGEGERAAKSFNHGRSSVKESSICICMSISIFYESMNLKRGHRRYNLGVHFSVPL